MQWLLSLLLLLPLNVDAASMTSAMEAMDVEMSLSVYSRDVDRVEEGWRPLIPLYVSELLQPPSQLSKVELGIFNPIVFFGEHLELISFVPPAKADLVWDGLVEVKWPDAMVGVTVLCTSPTMCIVKVLSLDNSVTSFLKSLFVDFDERTMLRERGSGGPLKKWSLRSSTVFPLKTFIFGANILTHLDEERLCLLKPMELMPPPALLLRSTLDAHESPVDAFELSLSMPIPPTGFTYEFVCSLPPSVTQVACSRTTNERLSFSLKTNSLISESELRSMVIIALLRTHFGLAKTLQTISLAGIHLGSVMFKGRFSEKIAQ